MRFYKKKNSESFVGVDLENQKVSTRSSYPHAFFNNLYAGSYQMFPFSKFHISDATEEHITFTDLGDSLNPELPKMSTYYYIGEATTTEELKYLLKPGYINLDKIVVDIVNGTNELKGDPCYKQSVRAMIITPSGEKVYGANHIHANVTACPRVTEGYKTGEGYHLCKDTCHQEFHAERDAIKNANEQGIDITNGNLFMIGHTYCCNDCVNAMKEAKIKSVTIVDITTEEYSFTRMEL